MYRCILFEGRMTGGTDVKQYKEFEASDAH